MDVEIEYEDGLTPDRVRGTDEAYAPGERVVLANGEPARVRRTVASLDADGNPTLGVEVEGTDDRYPLHEVSPPGTTASVYGVLEMHGEDLVLRPIESPDEASPREAVVVERSPRVSDEYLRCVFEDDGAIVGEVALSVEGDKVTLDLVKWSSGASPEELEKAPAYGTAAPAP